MAAGAAAGLHRAQHRADLRRGLCRFQACSRRRPRIFRRARRYGDLRQELRRRIAGRRGLRSQGPDAPLSRASPGRYLLCPRHLQLAPLCHDRDGRIPEPDWRARLRGDLPRARRDLECPGAAIERDAGRARPAGSRCQSVVDLDGALYRAVALQLDAAILSAGGTTGAELGRHRPPDIQPQLPAMRTLPRWRSALWPRPIR